MKDYEVKGLEGLGFGGFGAWRLEDWGWTRSLQGVLSPVGGCFSRYFADAKQCSFLEENRIVCTYRVCFWHEFREMVRFSPNNAPFSVSNMVRDGPVVCKAFSAR